MIEEQKVIIRSYESGPDMEREIERELVDGWYIENVHVLPTDDNYLGRVMYILRRSVQI